MYTARLCVLAAALCQALAAVIVENKFVTVGGNTYTTTVTPGASTVDYTSVQIERSTIFVASTTPTTSATGTIVTDITTTKSNPVQPASNTQVLQLTASIVASTYTDNAVVSNTEAGLPSLSKTTDSAAVVTSSAVLPASSSSSTSTPPSVTQKTAYYPNGNLMAPIDVSSPPSMFSRQAVPLSLPKNIGITEPLQTNKFFGNLLLDTQQLNAFCQPYNLFWSKDTNYYGFGISYTTADDRVFVYDSGSTTASYFMSPLDVKSFVFSAEEFSSSNMEIAVTHNDPLAAVASLSAAGGSITFPLSIGMGLATGIYKGLTPKLFSQIGVNVVVREQDLSNGIQKYSITLFNNVRWNLYVTVPAGKDFEFTVASDYTLQGSAAVDGLVVQFAVVTGSNDNNIDKAAGAYPVSGSVDASVNNDVATYSLNYNVEGSSLSGSTLIYALPHHIDSFTGETSSALTDYKVNSRTKGWLQGVLTNSLKMSEPLYTDLQWLPYQPGNTNNVISAEALQLMASVVNSELSEVVSGQILSSSTYTAGKALDKFAYILLVASEILKNKDVTQEGLESLKTAFEPFTKNRQPTPFIYDTLCKGVTSSASDVNADYGSPLYNDHHFHYGYLIHVAAVIGMLDKKYNDGAWVIENKDWVNSLVRDVANPSTQDTYFPIFRMFDFYSGHSWAAGMFPSADGKNEESTSEDYNFAYGMKLWGQVIGDKAMEARGDLMLSILKRSLEKYFLYTQDNTVEPSQYIGNYVAGISYENKLAHTTFFGTNEEYIQGIQMIPITGASGLIRSKAFVQQEWDAKLAPIISSIDSTWTNILRSNQALIDPVAAYKWFSADNFDSTKLDGGASRSWYLALAASLGGSS